MKWLASKGSQLVQKEYKTRPNWIGNVIHWELYRRIKFDHNNKWCIHKSESILENETHRIIWDFEIQTQYQILTRGSHLVLMNKKRTYHLVDFTVRMDHKGKIKEREKRKYLDLTWVLEKLQNMKLALHL